MSMSITWGSSDYFQSDTAVGGDDDSSRSQSVAGES